MTFPPEPAIAPLVPNPTADPLNPPFNWRTCWYPIAFHRDLPLDRPYGFSIYDQPFVLFRNAAGEWVCLTDRCPHRAAKLSDGQVLEGRLECLYHGWQFGSEGICLQIPHLQASATIPHRATVQSFTVVDHQGIVWVWAGEPATADRDRLPTIDEITAPDVFVVDTLTDLPYDHTFLVENLLDPAHVYISHDRTEIGIRREDAQPLEMEILSNSVAGIQGRFRGTNRAQAPWTAIHFIAPSLVHYSFSNAAFGLIGGLALYALPTRYGHSRALIRRYGNRFKRSFTLKPRWLEHLRQNKILEEDLAFIVEQQRYVEQAGRSLKEVYLPLNTADVFVMEHRKWLDQFGADLPWYEGYATAKAPREATQVPAPTELPTRWIRHTQHCGSCRPAHHRLQRIKQVSMGSAIALVSIALITDGWLNVVCTVGFVAAMAAIGLSSRLKTHFEHSFTRH